MLQVGHDFLGREADSARVVPPSLAAPHALTALRAPIVSQPSEG
jgi:hypothetical protein